MKIENAFVPLVFASLIVFPLMLASVAHASTPTSGSGAFSSTLSLQNARSADGNTFNTDSITITFSGTESGTCAGTIAVVFHPDGTDNFAGSCSFTGTVGSSSSGTAEFVFVGTGAGLAFTGTLVGTQGIGGLEGLHLVHTFAGSLTSLTTSAGTYTVQYHFDSQ